MADEDGPWAMAAPGSERGTGLALGRCTPTRTDTAPLACSLSPSAPKLSSDQCTSGQAYLHGCIRQPRCCPRPEAKGISARRQRSICPFSRPFVTHRTHVGSLTCSASRPGALPPFSDIVFSNKYIPLSTAHQQCKNKTSERDFRNFSLYI
jgi:hypothetical protein